LLALVFARSTGLMIGPDRGNSSPVSPPDSPPDSLPDSPADSPGPRVHPPHQRPLLPLWWGLVAATALFTAYFPLPPFWTSARIDKPLTEFVFSKRLYLLADRFLAEQIPPDERPALVLMEVDDTQFHFEYITNDPDLRRNPILRGRLRPGRTSLPEVIAAFPEQSIFLWRMRSGEFRRIAERRQP
jgi:hypothetical protein